MSNPSAARIFEFAQVDVFAEQPLQGNMLAIFTDARGLSVAEMQALARETNLCETTFILPRDPDTEASRGVQVRIFTTQEELEFAGHPTLGTASWLYWNHPTLQGAAEIRIDLRAGCIPVRFAPRDSQGAVNPLSSSKDESEAAGVFATMRQNDPVFGSIHRPEEVAAALHLRVEDLDPALPIQTVSTGMSFCIVPLRSLEVAARLQIPQHEAGVYLAATDAKFFYCITRAAAASRADWHARMQFYNGEDPATGSASGCTIAYLVRHGLVESDRPAVIEQGIEMRRPSLIHVRAFAERSPAGIHVTNVFVGGRTIPVASGRFFLP